MNIYCKSEYASVREGQMRNKEMKTESLLEALNTSWKCFVFNVKKLKRYTNCAPKRSVEL